MEILHNRKEDFKRKVLMSLLRVLEAVIAKVRRRIMDYLTWDEIFKNIGTFYVVSINMSEYCKLKSPSCPNIVLNYSRGSEIISIWKDEESIWGNWSNAFSFGLGDDKTRSKKVVKLLRKKGILNDSLFSELNK